ncbi:uncharacterized protein L3040_006326 [Drepanopeziza brunnea f. sp. 'multigermtubi']|uniref:uncharacterized protein n=1 Tax=Drepanopeziza brunnea f. sp. 'multigermtubi' TaxID=698441 RepID=UPI00239C0DF4|nr:hypothetical protein L3040_006326 [Drepanopeziza brunnea f. sp. 'multigermtubi']
MPRSRSVFAILLALSFFFNGAQALFWRKKIVIGYAVVIKEYADEINDDHKLRVEEPTSYNPQLGNGFYMLNNPDGLPTGVDYWYCAVKARRWKMKKAGKAYIPQYNAQRQTLWAGSEEGFVNYIGETAKLPEPKRALRFSWTKVTDWVLQMVIPSAVVTDDRGFNFWAQCFESKEELKKFSKDIIDWGSLWKIKGDPGPKLDKGRR